MRWKWFLILICVIFFAAGCARQKGVLFYTEEYWWSLYASRGDFPADFAAAFRQRGYQLSIAIAPKGVNYFEDLRQSIQRYPGDIVMAGPLMSADVIRLAPLYPEKRFIILPSPRFDELIPDNVSLVRQERQEAFFEAGRVTAQAITDGNNPLFGKKVGIILSGLTKEENEMRKEFERGFSLFEQTAVLLTEQINTSNDRVKALQAVENLYNRDVKIFFLKTYGLNGVCMEKIAGLGAYFIVEDYSLFNLFPDRLFISIENNYDKFFAAMTNLPERPNQEPLVLEAVIQRGAALAGATQ